MMKTNRRSIAAACAALVFGFCSAIATAEDRPYTEGSVVTVSTIRTEYGHFDDYMKFLATTWKQQQEAAKKAGLILEYQVLQAQPRGPNDPDVYLVVTYKNWAALDGLTAKSDAIATQVYGSVVKSNQGATDRSKIRRTLGSETMQVLNLK